MIHQFYAVTNTSVYFVKDKEKNGPNPFARKIALKGESAILVGEDLEGAMMIAITKQLQAYIPEGGGMTSFQRRIEGVNTRYWGGHSSNIIALFTSKKKAMECFHSEDLVDCDSRWIEDTKRVLRLIGDNHPTFEVCHWGDLALIPTEVPV